MKNSTDLHIQYHMETGKWHEWEERYTGHFHSTENYSREYAKWLEEKYLEKIDKEEHLQELEETIENLNDEVQYWIDEHNNLGEEIEDLHQANAGADL